MFAEGSLSFFTGSQGSEIKLSALLLTAPYQE